MVNRDGDCEPYTYLSYDGLGKGTDNDRRMLIVLSDYEPMEYDMFILNTVSLIMTDENTKSVKQC